MRLHVRTTCNCVALPDAEHRGQRPPELPLLRKQHVTRILRSLSLRSGNLFKSYAKPGEQLDPQAWSGKVEAARASGEGHLHSFLGRPRGGEGLAVARCARVVRPLKDVPKWCNDCFKVKSPGNCNFRKDVARFPPCSKPYRSFWEECPLYTKAGK